MTVPTKVVPYAIIAYWFVFGVVLGVVAAEEGIFGFAVLAEIAALGATLYGFYRLVVLMEPRSPPS